ncbi:serine hydrolase [Brevundimonas aurifodinae]|uniref:Serine hydrolase n=1 Tax=Brevundimonas aurifodinae TaxID=1508312 RepID=A0ABV1NLN3_9CAUL
MTSKTASPRQGRSPRLAAIAYVLIATVGLAGCGGSGGSPTSSTEPPPAPPPSPPPPPPPPPPSGAPATPKGLLATPSRGQLEVGWTANTESDLAAYLLTFNISGSSATQTIVVNAPATQTVLTGLQEGAEYTLTLVARDAGGDLSAVTPAITARTARLPTAAETAAYQSAAAYSNTLSGNAVVIMRDGLIVFEQYASSFSQTSPNPLASGTKSFSCAFAVAAETDGLVKIDDLASVYLPEWTTDPNKSRIKISDLLSLQAGMTGDPNYSATNVQNLDTYTQAINTDPATYAPGETFIYDPLVFQAYAAIFERRAAGEDPIAYLQRRVFDPIGLVVSSWQRDRVANPQMAGGANMTARDWLKYGQLAVQNGAWQGRRVLDADRFQRCLTFPNAAYAGYGLTWWLNRPVGDTIGPLDRIPEDGRAGPSGQIAPSAPADMAMAAGTGKQRLYVIPSLGLTIVRYAPLNSGVGGGSAWSDETFLAKALGRIP